MNLNKKIILKNIIFILVVGFTMVYFSQAQEIKDDFKVTFEHTASSLTYQEFTITIQNLQPIKRKVEIATIIDNTNFPIDDLKNLEFYVWEEKSHIISVDDYGDCIKEVCVENNKTYAIECHNKTYSCVIGSHEEEQSWYEWEDCKMQHFKRTAKVYKENMGKINIPKFGSDDENGTKIFKLRINTPLTERENGWGSEGIFHLDLEGFVFEDLTHSSWWNSSWAKCKNITISGGNSSLAYTNFPISFTRGYNITGLTKQDDSDDIRIVSASCGNGGAELPYSLLTNTSDSAEVMFFYNKSAGTDTVYSVYYNNSAVSAPSYTGFVPGGAGLKGLNLNTTWSDCKFTIEYNGVDFLRASPGTAPHGIFTTTAEDTVVHFNTSQFFSREVTDTVSGKDHKLKLNQFYSFPCVHTFVDWDDTYLTLRGYTYYFLVDEAGHYITGSNITEDTVTESSWVDHSEQRFYAVYDATDSIEVLEVILNISQDINQSRMEMYNHDLTMGSSGNNNYFHIQNDFDHWICGLTTDATQRDDAYDLRNKLSAEPIKTLGTEETPTPPDTTAPTVTQNLPADNASLLSVPITFNCSATDETALANISIYGNFTNSFILNSTNNVTGTDNSTTFSLSPPAGSHLWACEACDSSSNCNMSGNRTFSYSLPMFNFTIEDYGIEWVELNWT